MDPMLESFIAESRENLETAGRCFLELEKTPGDEGLMNDLFRSMHTIKGSSGLFDIPSLTKVVHAAEDVLDTVRDGELDLTSEYIDLFLDTMDQVTNWLDDLETNGVLAEGAEEKSQLLTKELRALLGQNETNNATDEVNINQPTDLQNDLNTYVDAPEWLGSVPYEFCVDLFKQSINDKSDVVLIEYKPDEKCFFTGDDPLHTVRNLPELIWFNIKTIDSWADPEELDPYKCNLSFYILASGNKSEIGSYFRYVNEQIKVSHIQPHQLIIPSGDVGENEPYEGFIREAEHVINNQDWGLLRKMLAPLKEISGTELLQTSVFYWMDALLDESVIKIDLLKALYETLKTGVFQYKTKSENKLRSDLDSVRSLDAIETQEENATDNNIKNLTDSQLNAAIQALDTQIKILTMPCQDDLLIGRITSVSMVVENLLRAVNTPLDALHEATEMAKSEILTEPLMSYLNSIELQPPSSSNSQKETKLSIVPEAVDKRQCERRKSDRRKNSVANENPSIETEATSSSNKVLKVDQQRIDTVMDLVGELVVAKNALPFLAKRADDDFGVPELAKEITAQYAVINRLSEELQSMMMQIRMVPISNVFQRFPRLVRDLSRKLDKNIRLELEGEETEADKNVVESLADPLIHLVRNSLDHGLEKSDEREESGKTAQGTIKLKAIPNDDQVIIEVIDDGRGIDPEVIKRKAYEKGVIGEQRLDTINDQEALQLILAPGFSTAEEVSDLSGRGVGMDVVNSAVTQAGGTVVINSVKGIGSTVRLSLPLSMAVSQVMMIEVAAQSYGISMEYIVETVRIPHNYIQKIKHNEAVVLRGRLIPLFHLRQLLQLEPIDELPNEVAVLVLKLAGEEVGLIIDDFHGGIDIIQKPLEGVMANYPYYSGAALLGDGRVLLILNIMELLACR